jgi:hypothetical protein
MKNLNEIKIEADLFNEIWSSSDLNPDILTNEINHLFTKNGKLYFISLSIL